MSWFNVSCSIFFFFKWKRLRETRELGSFSHLALRPFSQYTSVPTSRRFCNHGVPVLRWAEQSHRALEQAWHGQKGLGQVVTWCSGIMTRLWGGETGVPGTCQVPAVTGTRQCTSASSPGEWGTTTDPTWLLWGLLPRLP